MFHKDTENKIKTSLVKEERRNLSQDLQGVSKNTARKDNPYPIKRNIIEEVLEFKNMKEALKRVVGNKGSPGVDKMTTEDLSPYLKEHWPRIREELLEGNYKPRPVKGVEIPKPGGGIRKLGIPTVLDRLIQQAMHQILSPIFEEEFSEYSYGFRPGRSTHQAIQQAQKHIAQGKRWVVDIDLEKFFDKVNHDILMSRIARKIQDKKALLLIRRFLQAGLMEGGLISARVQGTPQGGPLSPLLSNIMLNDLDQELEKRRHSFCRYADDCNIYVQSESAGQRVMQSIKEFLEDKIKLKINEKKSAVARPWERKFLGYSFTNDENPKLIIAQESVKRIKDKIRDQCCKGRGMNVEKFIKSLTPQLRGWRNYFKLVETLWQFQTLDKWIRRKLRCIIWRQLKQSKTREKAMIKQGVSPNKARESAGSQKGPWRSSIIPGMHQAFPNKYFEKLGLYSLSQVKTL